jgi:hypothetical protein
VIRKSGTGTSKRHTISVRGETYQRLRDQTAYVGPLVDDLVVQALDSPEILARIVRQIATSS